jgi:predicted dehydrogenase
MSMAKSGKSSTPKKLRHGILGCGGIANAHAKAILQIPEYEFVAFCDVFRASAERFKAEYGKGQGEIFEDYHQMFEKMDLDVVTICLPPFAHADEVETAAKHGVHIFIEKPIALNVEKAQAMVDAVKKAKVKSQVGFMMRFQDGIERIKELLDAGRGPGVQFVGRYYCNSLHAPWWRMQDKSGGQMVEQIIHQFDLCRYLLGKPKQVFASTANLCHGDVENYTSEDVSGVVVRFQSGAVGVLTGTNCAIPGKWLAPWTFVAKGLMAEQSGGATQITHTDRSSPYVEEIRSEKNGMLAEQLDLLRAIREDGETRTPMLEGLESLRLVLGARDSAESGRPKDL